MNSSERKVTPDEKISALIKGANEIFQQDSKILQEQKENSFVNILEKQLVELKEIHDSLYSLYTEKGVFINAKEEPWKAFYYNYAAKFIEHKEISRHFGKLTTQHKMPDENDFRFENKLPGTKKFDADPALEKNLINYIAYEGLYAFLNNRYGNETTPEIISKNKERYGEIIDKAKKFLEHIKIVDSFFDETTISKDSDWLHSLDEVNQNKKEYGDKIAELILPKNKASDTAKKIPETKLAEPSRWQQFKQNWAGFSPWKKALFIALPVVVFALTIATGGLATGLGFLGFLASIEIAGILGAVAGSLTVSATATAVACSAKPKKPIHQSTSDIDTGLKVTPSPTSSTPTPDHTTNRDSNMTDTPTHTPRSTSTADSEGERESRSLKH